LDDGVGARREMQNGGVAGDAEAEAVARFGEEAEGDEHVGLFEGIEDFIEARGEMRGVVTAGQQHAGGAFDHAHDDAGGHAVAGNIGDVGDPVVGIAGEIDEVASDFAAGGGATVKFPGAEFRFDGRDQDAVDFGGEFDFGLDAEVAAALFNIYDKEADIAEDCRDDDGVAVDGESFLLIRDRRRIHLRGRGKVVEVLGDQITEKKLGGENWEGRRSRISCAA